MFGRSGSGNRLMEDPWGGIAPALRSSGHFAFNLETTIGSGGTARRQQFVFQSPAAPVKALAALARPVAGLANNHTMDFGADGLAGTLGSLDAMGLAHAGAGLNAAQAFEPAALEVNGRAIRIFSAGVDNDAPSLADASRPGLAGMDVPLLERRISAARGPAALVIVMIHWGVEYRTWYDSSQERTARALVDAGADLVVGTGPHVLQGIERYHNGLICYSIGNLVFDDVKSGDASAGALVKINVAERRYFLAPLRIKSVRAGPQLPSPDDARAIVGNIASRSPRKSVVNPSAPILQDGLLWFEIR